MTRTTNPYFYRLLLCLSVFFNKTSHHIYLAQPLALIHLTLRLFYFFYFTKLFNFPSIHSSIYSRTVNYRINHLIKRCIHPCNKKSVKKFRHSFIFLLSGGSNYKPVQYTTSVQLTWHMKQYSCSLHSFIYYRRVNKECGTRAPLRALHCGLLVLRYFWSLFSCCCCTLRPTNHVKLSSSTLGHCLFLYWKIYRWKTTKECDARLGRSC